MRVAVVVSDGTLASIDGRGPTWSFPSISRGLMVAQNVYQTYGEMYRRQPAIRTVVDFLARNVAEPGVHAFERVSDTDRRRLAPTEHQLAALFAVGPGLGPNPSTTPYRLIHALVSDKAIYDDAYWIKIRDTGKRVVGVRRIPPWRIRPKEGDWFDTDVYELCGTRATLDIDAENVVHFKGYDPEDERHGVPPMESLRLVLAEEYAAAEYRAQLWARGARMAGWLERPADAPEWDDKGKERFLSDWNAQWTGDGPGAGGTPLLEDGMQFHAAGVTPKEAQYVESRKLTREEAAAAYHIPLPLVGLLEHATFSNIKEQHQQLYADTLGPWFTSTEQEIALGLVGEFPRPDRVYVEFNVGAKLRASFEEQAAVLQAAVGAPYMTRNEARARLNLNAVDGGDELITPLNVTEGGQASPQDSAPPKARRRMRSVWSVWSKATSGDQLDAHTAALVAFFERQARSVAGKYAAAAADTATLGVELHQVWDRARWDRELAADLGALAEPLTIAAATAVLTDLGGDPTAYDPAQTTNFLAAWNDRAASGVNAATENQLVTAIADADPTAAIAALFAAAVAQRAAEIARTQVTGLTGWSTVEAARQGGHTGARKQWLTGKNPRASHAAMNGQTVPLDDKFSNGCRWPADSVEGSADEVAGCNCALVIIPEGVEE